MGDKGYKGIGMKGPIARWYSKVTFNDLEQFRALARRMSSELEQGARVLEVAPGPGYFAIELGKLGKYEITGLDISETFVEIARMNAKREGVTIDFQHGNASSMPFADNSFDLIVCRAAFKNFSAPVEALREMRRVLRSDGRALIIDLRRDASKQEIDAYIEEMKVGNMNAAFMKVAFRAMLLKRAYTRDEFARFAEQSGFQRYDVLQAPLGFEVWLYK